MNAILIIIASLAIFKFSACSNQPIVFVAEEGRYKDYTYTIPFDFSAKGKKETLADLGVIYEGMPAEDLRLYGFGEKELIRAYTRGSNKYLVFPKKINLKKVIIFVVRKNKVIDWFEDDAELIN
ncbi:MAG: hypothetical protein K9L95_03255 [Candidatus Omnitrophica bacterium]|nr:hypothetical protein [Candidatus Omnitrophota bacterium]MCF7878468.1 hypothetical protein [Candidatus Omnitrophota bacterium]MCF7893267.1 hypothetical protein [Candidatus Omnitrophota bacterium]